MNYIEKLIAAQRKNKSCVCVGLDPDPYHEKFPDRFKDIGIPAGWIREFLEWVIEETGDIAAVFKANLGFFLRQGSDGIAVLEALRNMIPDEIPLIIDYKSGDIGNSAMQYAHAAFETFGADAVTINAYMGSDCVNEFTKLGFAYALCKTSNKSAGEFQDLWTVDSLNARGPHKKLYERIAGHASQWHKDTSNCGIVFGATYPIQLKSVCAAYPGLPRLLPGIGKQEGDLKATIDAVRFNDPEDRTFIVNSSRGIIFNEDPAEAADKLRNDINALLPEKFFDARS